jgi:hypothetical protein
VGHVVADGCTHEAAKIIWQSNTTGARYV